VVVVRWVVAVGWLGLGREGLGLEGAIGRSILNICCDFTLRFCFDGAMPIFLQMNEMWAETMMILAKHNSQ
jgi:hypothetical protein